MHDIYPRPNAENEKQSIDYRGRYKKLIASSSNMQKLLHFCLFAHIWPPFEHEKVKNVFFWPHGWNQRQKSMKKHPPLASLAQN